MDLFLVSRYSHQCVPVSVHGSHLASLFQYHLLSETKWPFSKHSLSWILGRREELRDMKIILVSRGLARAGCGEFSLQKKGKKCSEQLMPH